MKRLFFIKCLIIIIYSKFYLNIIKINYYLIKY